MDKEITIVEETSATTLKSNDGESRKETYNIPLGAKKVAITASLN